MLTPWTTARSYSLDETYSYLRLLWHTDLAAQLRLIIFNGAGAGSNTPILSAIYSSRCFLCFPACGCVE